jgi:phosphate transport system permease protein
MSTATTGARGGPDRGAAGSPARVVAESGSLPSRAPVAVLAAAVVAAAVLRATTNVSFGLLLVGAVVVSGIVVYAWSRAVEGSRRATDRAVTFVVTAAFALAVAPLVSLLYTVVTLGVERFDPQFFTESSRNVVGEGGGAAHAILGTLVITVVATLASVPVGIMAAIYLHEYGRGRLAAALTFFVDVMTGIPSIVAGLFAYALFVLFFGPGIRLGVMGAVALSVLMIPIVVRSTEEMLKIVPGHLREASYALGVPKWRTVTKVVLPTALAGIITGSMLAVARIVGETAPLLITTGVFSSVNLDPFDGRMQNLAVYAYNEYANPGVPIDPYLDRAWAAALTLIVIVMALNLVARLVYRRYGTEIR